jgi:UDP-glucose 4-epimerase
MKVAVTGATGFIGRTLCGVLSDAGHETIVVDLRAEQDAPRFDGVDAVVHLAAIAHRRGANPVELDRVNVELAAQVGRASAAAGGHLIFISSVKVHGEETLVPLRETSALAPLDAYGQSKVRAEHALRAMPGLRLTILRPPLVYGPGVKANFLALMKAIARGIPLPLASVENRRSLVYVGNLAQAIARCIATRESEGRVYLVSDGEPKSTPELCRALGRALDHRARLVPFPRAILELASPLKRLTRSLEVDDSAIRGELAWSPGYSFDEGLRATAQWYREVKSARC